LVVLCVHGSIPRRFSFFRNRRTARNTRNFTALIEIPSPSGSEAAVAERYVIEAHSKPPQNLPELKNLLATYVADQPTRKRIELEVLMKSKP